MKNVLISACLLGIPCRYDGKSKRNVKLGELAARCNFIPVCPECLGGLPTPRVPSERVGDKVLMRDGRDVTENFKNGAKQAYNTAVENGCRVALLKERSPSCGCGEIYDGSFTGVLTSGDGVCAELLKKCGIAVFGENKISELEKAIDKLYFEE